MPASTPQQFPGVNGQVDYSEGIDVGYRHYDATNETPLFPFGFGLSYTTFKYSHLKITPDPVMNTASNPGTTSCKCNGQSTNEVTVSAQVTNTGKIAGADVAQLYLGDPAVAAEPPRQLKGFDRVNLAPGASTTVQFTLNGHDLSYFNETANGWVLPDGRFNVFVGDSSALKNLPLRATSPSRGLWELATPRSRRRPPSMRVAPARSARRSSTTATSRYIKPNSSSTCRPAGRRAAPAR